MIRPGLCSSTRNQFLMLILLVFVMSGCVSTSALERYRTDVQPKQDSLLLTLKTDRLRVINRHDYLVQNSFGNWELYASGSPYELGNKMGLLSQDLFETQRTSFLQKLEEIVPSKFKRKLILRFVNWYNRRLDNYIQPEYLEEIYALSTHVDDRFAFAGDPFHQLLYMHAAHDLGHALQDLAIVGCSSVASWGNKTADGELLIGRNFDFYLSDDFSKNKVINFIRPQEGIPFASVSWAGMVGVVSGMNLEGLTLTMNAGKSSIPLSAKTPISIIAREILQYASTIEEAIAIAKKRKPFVSESLMIGSAKDNMAVLLEISPKSFAVYAVENQDKLICTNHFQSKEYENDRRNVKHIVESHSLYRQDRLRELLKREELLSPQKMATILRNTAGLGDQNIGLGNDKSLAHLMAHHAVIFQPAKRLMWVSNAPYQLGAFNAYDLAQIFSDTVSWTGSKKLDSLTIPADDFLKTKGYRDYENFRKETNKIVQIMKENATLSLADLDNYQALNPNLWFVYYLSGKYWMQQRDYKAAFDNFDKALSKVIPTTQTEDHIQKLREKAQKKWKE